MLSMVLPYFRVCRANYNHFTAGSRRPPSGAMGIPPAGARASYRAPTGELKFWYIFAFNHLFLADTG